MAAPRSAGVHYSLAATCSFLVAVTNNYIWNRLWTFRGQRGHVGAQGLRFLVVSLVALGGEPARCLHRPDRVRPRARSSRRRSRSSLVTPLNFIGNKLWSFRPRALTGALTAGMRVRRAPRPRVVLARAGRVATPTAPVYDKHGRIVQTPFAPSAEQPHLTKAGATAIFLRDHKVDDWLDRYPRRAARRTTTFTASDGSWTVQVWWGARGRDRDAAASTTRTGASPRRGPGRRWRGRWRAATRARSAASGSTSRGSGSAFCARLLARPRRPAPPAVACGTSTCSSCSRSRVSLWYFNRGDVFTSVPLAYPPLVYLLGRMRLDRRRRGRRAERRRRSGRCGCSPRRRSSSSASASGSTPRLERDRRRLLGRDRRAAHRDGQSPYGHFPIEDDPRRRAGQADADGEIRDRIQTNGRCETANEHGRHVRPGRVRGLPARLLDLRLVREVGRPPAAHFTLGPVRHHRHARPRARRAAASAAGGWRRRSPSRGRRTRSPQYVVELEHERRDHARVPDLRLLARRPRLGRAARRSALVRRGRSSRR